MHSLEPGSQLVPVLEPQRGSMFSITPRPDRYTVLLTVALLVATAAADAQINLPGSAAADTSRTAMVDSVPNLGTIPKGLPLRVFLGNGQVVHGQLTHFTGDSALFESSLAGGRLVAVPVASIVAIDGKRDPQHQRNRMYLGLGIGMVSGLLIGQAVGSAQKVEPPTCEAGEGNCLDFSGFDRAGNALNAGLIGMLTGGIVGAIVGHASSDGWQRIHGAKQIALVPVWKPTGRVGFHASVTLRRLP